MNAMQENKHSLNAGKPNLIEFTYKDLLLSKDSQIQLQEF